MPANGPSYRFKTCLLILACLTALIPQASADTGEYQVKAAMIYNMIRFMDWPDEALPSTSTQLTVCVAGKGQLSTAVNSLQGKQVKGKVITVRQLASGTNTTGCQVLVFSDLDKSTSLNLLERIRSSALLTISDSAGFARSGGIVGFALQEGKVRFEINQAASQRHRIRISAQLLKLASIVQESP